MKKLCTTCNKELDARFFSPRKPRPSSYKDGLDYVCKMCRSERGTHKVKYSTNMDGIEKIPFSNKHYMNEKGQIFSLCKVGLRKIKGEVIGICGKQFQTKGLKEKLFAKQPIWDGRKAQQNKQSLKSEYDKLIDELASMQSLMTPEADKVIKRINEIEYCAL